MLLQQPIGLSIHGGRIACAFLSDMVEILTKRNKQAIDK